MSYPFFPKSIRILKKLKCEIAPPGTQIDVRCMQPRFENSPCCAWSIRRDVSQVLHRQTFPCSTYDALLARGQGPDSAGTCPFTSIRDAMKTACVEACLLPRDIIIFKCTKIQYQMVYRSWGMVCDRCNSYFLAWPIFFFFSPLPPDSPKNQNGKKMKKKLLEISSFYTYIPKIMIRWCTVPEKWCATDRQMDRWKKWSRGGCPTL